MKRFILAVCVIALATPALALDMATTFGAAHTATAPPTTHQCKWNISKTTITANGVDSAVVAAVDENNAAITTLSLVNVTGAGGQVSAFANVTLPKTLTSTGPGQWDFNAVAANGASCVTFSIVAQ